MSLSLSLHHCLLPFLPFFLHFFFLSVLSPSFSSLPYSLPSLFPSFSLFPSPSFSLLPFPLPSLPLLSLTRALEPTITGFFFFVEGVNIKAQMLANVYCREREPQRAPFCIHRGKTRLELQGSLNQECGMRAAPSTRGARGLPPGLPDQLGNPQEKGTKGARSSEAAGNTGRKPPCTYSTRPCPDP